MLGRLNRLVQGLLEGMVSKLEERNPQALLEAEKAALREAVARYNQNLALQAALVENLRTQVERETAQVDKLKARITALVLAEDAQAAGPLALEAKTRAQELVALRERVAEADQRYRLLTGERDEYVREARRRLEALG